MKPGLSAPKFRGNLKPAPEPARAEGTTKGHENAEGMALGCVRVDLTVRLGRGVEGVEHTATWPWFDEQ